MILDFLNNITSRVGPFKRVVPFSTAGQGNNAPVTAKVVNDIITALNALNINATVDFVYRITETLGVPILSLSKMSGLTADLACPGSTCVGCTGKESPACTGCPSKPNGSTFYNCGKANASLVRTGLGVYELTLAPDFAYANVVVSFGNIGYTGGLINVTRVSDILYTITVVNTATGTALNGELTNTPIFINFWQ